MTSTISPSAITQADTTVAKQITFPALVESRVRLKPFWVADLFAAQFKFARHFRLQNIGHKFLGPLSLHHQLPTFVSHHFYIISIKSMPGILNLPGGPSTGIEYIPEFVDLFRGQFQVIHRLFLCPFPIFICSQTCHHRNIHEKEMRKTQSPSMKDIPNTHPLKRSKEVTSFQGFFARLV